MCKLLQAALDYAELGWHVFPCKPRGKEPITSHGCKDATTDKEQIRKWWSEHPDANIAVACGEKSGIIVIDVDVHEGKNGYESLKNFPSLPETVTQHSPSSGCHYIFSWSNDCPSNCNNYCSGVDLRSDGYYIIVGPSVYLDVGYYSWKEKCSPWEIKLAKFPEFMGPKEKTHPTLPAYQRESQASENVLERASAYLAECDPAIQGQDGHSKLLYAASRMVNGFNLTDGEAYSILSKEYNPRCIPPWDLTDQKDEKDFRRKISEARKLGSDKPKGWLLDEYDITDRCNCVIDLDKLLTQGNKVHNASESISTRSFAGIQRPQGICSLTEQKDLNYLCNPPGLVGEICQWLNLTALRSQPFLSLASSLVFCGALMGRKVKDELGSRTNIYCMGVAPSSAGKQHAITQLRNLCSSAGSIELLGGDYIASDSAIEERLSRSPCTLFLWDEVGHLLSHIRSGVSKNHAMVVSLLMKMYSCAGSIYLGREYAEKEKQRTVIQPCCCIYGTSTPDRFVRGVSPEELQDGWLSRCLVFRTEDVPEKNREVNTQEAPPQSIIDKIRQIYEFSPEKENDDELLNYVTPYYDEKPPSQITIRTTQEAENKFIQFDNDTATFGKNNPQLNTLWAKGEENARRIALILSAGTSFENPIIDAEIASYSCDLVRYLLSDFTQFVAPEIVSNDTERNKRKIYNIIKRVGKGGITMNKLVQQTGWASKKQRQDIIEDLVYGGEVFCERTDKIMRYHATRDDNNSDSNPN